MALKTFATCVVEGVPSWVKVFPKKELSPVTLLPSDLIREAGPLVLRRQPVYHMLASLAYSCV